MKSYRCKHAVEAARWFDTAENREQFSAWFEAEDAMFVTRGSVIVLPEDEEVVEGEWVVYYDGLFLVMADESFRETYVEIDTRTER